MPFDANDAVLPNPRGASGPRTEAGKAKSSRNAIQYGLYAIHDHIREGEEEEYAGVLTSIMAELSPEGTLEETFCTQIMSAKWRLRRCGMVEFDLAEFDLDPMADEKTEKIQRSVDRARTQSLSNFRRSIADLRKLQTERVIHAAIEAEDIPCLTDIKHVLNTMKIHNKENAKEQAKEPQPKNQSDADAVNALEALMAMADKQLCQDLRDAKNDSGLIRSEPSVADAKPMVKSSFCKPAAPATPAASSFCKPAPAAGTSFCKPALAALIPTESGRQKARRGQTTPRNALCPCGSGKKYKRCHGNPVNPAAPVSKPSGSVGKAPALSDRNPGNGTKPSGSVGKTPTLSGQNPGNGTKPVVNKAA